MTDDQLFRSMTDDQLAQWDTMHRSMAEAANNLADARLTVERLLRDIERLKEMHGRKVTILSAELTDVQRKHGDQTSATRRANAAIVVILGALHSLLDAMGSDAVSRHQGEWPREVFKAISEAWEVVNAHDIPF